MNRTANGWKPSITFRVDQKTFDRITQEIATIRRFENQPELTRTDWIVRALRHSLSQAQLRRTTPEPEGAP